MKYRQILAVILPLLFFGCGHGSSSDSDSTFKDLLLSTINKSEEHQKTVFDELFGVEKSKQIALSYCQQRKSGEDRLGIFNHELTKVEKKLSEKKITSEESSDILTIQYVIYDIAEIVYCPEFNSYKSDLKQRYK